MTSYARGLRAAIGAAVVLVLIVGCGGSGQSPTPTPRTINPTIIATIDVSQPSPEADGSPMADYEIAPPADCTVEPRDIASLFGVATPIGDGTETAETISPDDLPAGEPVDDATAAAVTETINQWVACTNAGDDLRGYALVTDDFLRRSIAEFGMFAEEEIELMEASPEPLVADDQLAVIAIRDLRLLPDGRVGATIWIDSRTAPLPEDLALRFYVFAPVGDDWLIDEIVAIAS